MMRLISLCLLAAGLVNGNSGVFSVYDDLLAFPQVHIPNLSSIPHSDSRGSMR